MTEQALLLIGEKLQEVYQWEETFRSAMPIQWMIAHAEIPIFTTFIYLFIVFQGQKFFENREPFNLKPIVALWNLLLAVFSVWGAIRVVPYVLGKLLENGFRWTICTPAPLWFHNGAAGAWIFLFCWSKIPELIDTVFLVLQKKPVILLHWFHHFTVMLYCWHCYINGAPNAIYFVSMNLVVHSIMYSYYFFMCFSWGRAIVRPFAIVITSLQIIQMAFGMGISVSAFLFTYDSEGCIGADPANVKMGLAMYIAYFILFAQLFKKLYFGPKRSPTGRNGAKGTSELVTPQPSPTTKSPSSKKYA